MWLSCTDAPSPLSYSPAASLVPLICPGFGAHEPDSAPDRLWLHGGGRAAGGGDEEGGFGDDRPAARGRGPAVPRHGRGDADIHRPDGARALRSEEHTSELQSLMRISYAVFCLEKK